MATLRALYILSLSLAISLVVNSTQVNPINYPAVEFIHSNCNATLYPNLCFSSLSPYATAIDQNPLKLSQVATYISLSRIQLVKSRVSSFSTSTTLSSNTGSQMVAESLKDCAQLLGDAVDRTKDSIDELQKLKGAVNENEVRWFVSNVQTWMSAALTNEDTCIDGLKEAAGGDKISAVVMVNVRGRVGRAMDYTSNALALVNKLPYAR